VIKRLLPAVVAVVALALAGYTLASLDQVVQGTLYSYGLWFSHNGADQYWTLLRVTWSLLAVCAVTIIFNTILIVRPASEKPRSLEVLRTPKAMKITPTVTQAKETAPIVTPITSSTMPPRTTSQPLEKPTPKPTPIIAPASPFDGSDIPGLFRCSHCGKAFTQPLRMLDFHSDPPRIVNVCPFCSETMPSASVVKESEQDEKRSLFRKNNNHGQKTFTR